MRPVFLRKFGWKAERWYFIRQVIRYEDFELKCKLEGKIQDDFVSMQILNEHWNHFNLFPYFPPFATMGIIIIFEWTNRNVYKAPAGKPHSYHMRPFNVYQIDQQF